MDPSKAEQTRQRLGDAVRNDLKVLRADGRIIFPVDGVEATGEYEFEERLQRPARYQDLLDWPEQEKDLAPRAFDSLGDIAIVKIPPALEGKARDVGEALRRFLQARAVFHDRGVVGEFRTRDLVRIAGEGGTETTVHENGVRLTVDPAKAYYSPRLGAERARMVKMFQPTDHVVDLFGGVGPLAVQAAQVCRTTCVDLNPEACRLATINADQNKVDVDVICGDAKQVAATLDPADHIIMNLPHGAWDFLDAAAPAVKPGGQIHFHAIVDDDDMEPTRRLSAYGEILNRRHVRTYATGTSHYVWDICLSQ